MYRTLSTVLAFAAGAAVGSVVTWKYLKKRTDQIVESYEDEIDSIADMYANRKVAEDVSEEEPQQKPSRPSKPDLMAYATKIRDLEYQTETDPEPPKEEEERDMSKPYVIAPDEFGENPEYDTCSINYYNDHVLAYDWGAVVEDVDDTIGTDSLKHFGEYEPDAVYVRNDVLKCDYEILMSERNFADVLAMTHESVAESE